MLDFDLIKNVLVVAIAGSILTTTTIQKLKEIITKKKLILILSFCISQIIGTLFSICFSNLSLIDGFWVGFITWLGADAIYKTFEDKIFTSFSELHKEQESTKTLEDLEKEVEDE